MNKAKLAQKLFLFPLLLSVLFLISCEEVVGFAPINWVEVGTTGAPNFRNGWQNRSSSLQPLAFAKDQYNFLHIVGVVEDTTPTSANTRSTTIMFTLPEGFRPTINQYNTIAAWSQSAGSNIICNMTIFTNGDVVMTGNSPNWTYGLNVTVRLD